MRCQLVLLACLALVAVVQAAVSGPQTDSRSGVSGTATQTLTFNKFQGSLGTLTSVSLSISITGAQLTSGVFNSDSVNHQITALGTSYTGTLTTKDNGGTTLNTVPITASYVSSATPFTLTPSQNYQEPNQSPTTTQAQQTATVTTSLSSYTGTGTTDPLTVTVTGTTSVTPTGSDDSANKVFFSASATVSFLAGISYTYTPATVQGDPQIVGFQGQHFQIHGTPDEHYNLISSADYYVNSKFVYMATGLCNYNDTECFSHPGTYIGEIALVTGINHVKVASGPHSTGLTTYINDKLAPVGTRVRFDNSTSVHVISHNRVVLTLADFSISAVNSDLFLNLGVDFTNAAVLHAGHQLVTIPSSASPADADKLISTVYPEFGMHGILGQTWRNIAWPHHRLYQGEPADYQVATLFTPEFLYSEYQA